MKSLSQVKKYNNRSLAFRWVKLYNSVADAETPLRFICTDQKRTRKRFFFFDFCRWSKWTLKLILFEPIWKRWLFLLSLSHPYMQLKSLWLPLEALIFFRSILQERRPSSVGWFRLYLEYQYPLADVRGVPGTPPGPNSFIFMQFSAKKICKIIPICELAHPLGNILDPPLITFLQEGWPLSSRMILLCYISINKKCGIMTGSVSRNIHPACLMDFIDNLFRP